MRTSLRQCPTFNVGDMDLSFVHEMVTGGISDDGSPLIGDVSFDDNTDYSSVVVTNEELKTYAHELNLSFSF